MQTVNQMKNVSVYPRDSNITLICNIWKVFEVTRLTHGNQAYRYLEIVVHISIFEKIESTCIRMKSLGLQLYILEEQRDWPECFSGHSLQNGRTKTSNESKKTIELPRKNAPARN